MKRWETVTDGAMCGGEVDSRENQDSRLGEWCTMPFSQTGSTGGTGCELKQMSSFLSPLRLRNQEDTQEGSVS